MKRIEQDGKSYRIRRGKLVEIPDEWVGQVAFPQKLRRREQTAERKQKKERRRRRRSKQSN